MKRIYTLSLTITICLFFSFNLIGQDITGRVWEDTNGNGIIDGAESGINGVDVYLHTAGNVPTGISAVTAGGGNYTLTGGVVGTDYLVFVDMANFDASFVATTPNIGGMDSRILQDGSNVTVSLINLAAGGNSGINAGFYYTVSVDGVVWLDGDGNGMNDDGLTLPSSVDVSLYKESPLGSGSFILATDFEGNAITNAVNTSDAFLFDLLSPGRYYVEFTDGSAGSMYHTYADVGGGTTQGTDGSNDSDAKRTDGRSHQFQLLSGDGVYSDIAAGYFVPYNISGYVWLDNDGNGLDNEGGTGLPSAVEVILQIESPIGSGAFIPASDEFNSVGTLTNNINTTGAYAFNNLPPGNYRVLFSEPGDANDADLHLTAQDASGDGGSDLGDAADDSDPDRIAVGGYGITHEISLTAADRPSNFDVTTINAGYFLPVRIGDFVWEDPNADGDQADNIPLAVGDVPIDISLIRLDGAGIPVDVNGVDLSPSFPINQDGGGIYEFYPLPPGEYQVEFVWPEPTVFATTMDATGDDATDSDIMDCVAGGTPGMGLAPTTGLLTSGMSNITIDAGFFKPAKIEGLAWEDLNANGLQDGMGGPIVGLPVEIFEAGTLNPVNYADCSAAAGTVVTDGGGLYEFNNLRPGNYVLQFNPPSAPSQFYLTLFNAAGGPGLAGDVGNDSDADPANTNYTFDIAVMSDDMIEDIDAGMYRAVSIHGYVWEDDNGDGLDDEGGAALGVAVNVLLQVESPVGSAIFVDATLQIDGSALTNPVSTSSTYMFDNLPPGRYRVLFEEPGNTNPADYHLTLQDAAGDGGVDIGDSPNDSDADEMANGANYGLSHEIDATSDRMVTNVNAGYFISVQVGNLIWHDEDADGIMTAAEDLPIPAGFTVSALIGGAIVDNISGNPATVAVMADGSYNFINGEALRPGDYTFQITLPANWFLSQKGGGGTDDSDFDPVTFLTDLYMLRSGDINRDIDGGVWTLIMVGGVIWGDGDGDCMFGGTELGFDAIRLEILDNTGMVVGNTTSDAMGMYSFMVPPGDYTISVVAFNFEVGQPLNLQIPCGPGNDPNNNVVGDNNGNGVAGGPSQTAPVELRCGREPGANGIENKTIDFGFDFDCGVGNNPAAYLDCSEAAANPFCNILLFEAACGTMPDFANANGPNPLCPSGGAPHNLSWFSFIAGYGDYDIEINIFGCNPGTAGNLGIQSALYVYDPDNATCWGTETPLCNSGCSVDNIILDAQILIPGQQYIMFLDGCNGSYCGYEIDITGSFSPFVVSPAVVMDITCDGGTDVFCEVICPGTEIDFVVEDAANNYQTIKNLLFHWSLRDENGAVIEDYYSTGNDDFETRKNDFTWTFDNIGIYQLCLDDVGDACGNIVPAGICRTIEVIMKDPEDFGVSGVCENYLHEYSGPMYVNDDPSNTNDPNGDGLFGWQVNPTVFALGTNTVIATDSKGCSYEQTIDLFQHPDSQLGSVDTAVCGIFHFPVVFLDQPIDFPTYETIVELPKGDANGCDSMLSVTVLNLEIVGEIEFIGCEQGGYLLRFREDEISINEFDRAKVEFIWRDPFGSIIDPLNNDPYSIVVDQLGYYTFEAHFITDFQNNTVDITCVYDNFGINLDNVPGAPLKPQADNWRLKRCQYDGVATYVAISDLDPIDITSYNWTFPSNATVVSGLNSETLVLDWGTSTGGDVCVTITNDCGTSEELCQTIEITPTPVASITQLDSICVDSLITVMYPGTQDVGYNYAWKFNSGSPVGTTNNAGPINVSWASPGVKNVELVITKAGCVSTAATEDILVVEPVDPPTLSCESFFDEVVFTWDAPSGQTGYFPSILTSQTGGVLSGNTYTIGSLEVGDSVSIQLITTTSSPCGDLVSTAFCKAQNCPPNKVNIAPIADICVDDLTTPLDIINFTTLTNPVTGTYNFTGTAITDAAKGTFDPQLATIGNNVIPVVFKDDFDCSYNASITIKVNITPTSDFMTEDLVCVDSSIMVSYTGNITSGAFTWDAGDVINPLNGIGPFDDVTWMTAGAKTIMLDVLKSGCPSETTTHPVTVEPRIEELIIQCDEDATAINISWNDLDNVTDYILTITYPDNTSETFNLTGTNYNLIDLIPETAVDIMLEAVSDNSCPGVVDVKQCEAIDCPLTTLTLSKDTTICLDAAAVPFLIEGTVTGGLGIAGEKVWSGTGVDPVTGMFDPQSAGVGAHTVKLVYTELNCETEKTMTVTLINQPTSEFSAPDAICVAQALEVSYDGSAPNLPFNWTIEGGGVVTSAGTNMYEIMWNAPGTYDIDLQVGSGTCLSDVSSFTVQVDPEMDLVDITCKTTLSSVTFDWADIDCASEYEITINGTVQGTQTDLTYLASGLNEGDKVLISVLPIEECECPAMAVSLECEAKACPFIELELSSAVTSFCEGSLTNPIDLQVVVQGSETTGTGSWTGDGGVTAAGQFDPTGKTPGIYTFKYSYLESNCNFSETVSIEVLANPSVSALAMDPTCYQDNFGSVVISPEGDNGTNFTILVDNAELTEAELKALAPGTYAVQATDEEGCIAETTFNIQNAIAAQLELNGNTLIKAGDSGSLMADVTSIDGVLDSIVWYDNSSNEILCSGVDCASIDISPDPDAIEVEYCAVMYYNDGCTVSECITITIRKTNVIILPNVLIANSGNGNNEFYISDQYETVLQVKRMLIYDRWGNKMFTVENAPKGPGNGWNGRFNNQVVAPGVYVYIVELDMENGEVLKFSGDITVLF